MKKYIMLLLMVLSSFSYGAKELSSLKTLKFSATEKQTVNNKEKVLKYLVTIDFPDKIKKELTFPELNKGEIYVYNGEKKEVYLPIFDEYKESQIDGDENKIIQTINKIRDLEQVDANFKKDYQNKKLQSLYIDDSQTVLVYIREYLEQDDYVLPKLIEVKDGEINLGTVLLESVEVNPVLEANTFKLEKRMGKDKK